MTKNFTDTLDPQSMSGELVKFVHRAAELRGLAAVEAARDQHENPPVAAATTVSPTDVDVIG